MKEVWKIIDGLEHHEVSNTGKIRSVGNFVKTRDGKVRKMKDRELIGRDNGLGYRKLTIKEDGKEITDYIHRIVARAFVPNPLNKPCVNHIDNNPANNRSDNLEWVTHQENTDWMIAQGRNKRTKKWLDNLHKSQEKFYIPVVGKNVKTGEKIYFDSINSVVEGGFLPSMVCVCLKGRRKSHHGYTWERA